MWVLNLNAVSKDHFKGVTLMVRDVTLHGAIKDASELSRHVRNEELDSFLGRLQLAAQSSTVSMMTYRASKARYGLSLASVIIRPRITSRRLTGFPR